MVKVNIELTRVKVMVNVCQRKVSYNALRWQWTIIT